MLCACSGEQFKFEDPPRSPESLATRDFSASGLSSKTPRDCSASGISLRTPKHFSASGISSTVGDQGSKLEDSHVDEAESTLKEALSLNYEEARALLGRIEYQKGNSSAALELFQGIEISKLTPRMVKTISERSRPRKPRSKREIPVAGLMSMPSVSLLLEAILLKAKTLEELGRAKDAASECEIILDIVDSALPNGMQDGIKIDLKIQDMFHKALELLPKLWKQASFLSEAVTAYRRALVKPWNLDPHRQASVQKDLAVTLLYGGIETSNLEEAILLLFILMRKVLDGEIVWDPEIMDHLTFGLSICGGFEVLANHVEQVLPGIYGRAERWYILALCYSAAGQKEVAINLVKKVTGNSESKRKPHIPSLLLGAKMCSEGPKHALEGINFSRKVIESLDGGYEHLMSQAYKFLGICSGNAARIVYLPSSKREMYRRDSLTSLNRAISTNKDDPELMFELSLENAVQRNLDAALGYSMMHSNKVAESSGRVWILLALVLSAQQRFKDAETVVNLASEEVGELDHLELLRLKASLQIVQEQPKQAIETYGVLLALIQAVKELKTEDPSSNVATVGRVEKEAWQDLAKLYTKLESWADAEVCVEKAKSVEFYSPSCWHLAGMLSKARSLHREALGAFSVSLSMDPDYVPSIIAAAQVLIEFGGCNALPIARSLLMNALQLAPTNHDAWFNLGLIAKQEGLISQAADCFQAAAELKSSAPVENFL
ncbi:hypothetical protein Nepgr_018302 [Nepenthes gracilis]|uniref:Uncharacterized protein n=1 Tax=Nepenthes gracilis TaxID=150966 RepID=A0AAD3SUL9_NEPGR|nr:hypothetical protein Nepgr_018302 [Nepenthes gracilis]